MMWLKISVRMRIWMRVRVICARVKIGVIEETDVSLDSYQPQFLTQL